MRMWASDPVMMCKKHLGGEHVEMHMFKSVIESGKAIAGYIVNTSLIVQRHDAVVQELLSRGGKHSTPLFPIDYPLGFKHQNTVVPHRDMRELIRRCPVCRKLHEEKLARTFPDIPEGGDWVEKENGWFRAVYSGQPLGDWTKARVTALRRLEVHRGKMQHDQRKD